MSKSNQKIGLTDLIEQVKRELLASAPEKADSFPFLFVDSIELELQVAVSWSGNGGVKIEVLSIGGGEIGGEIERERIQTVKVTLSSLFDKKQLMEYYKVTHPNDVLMAVNENMKAVFKGDNQGSAEDTVL